MNIFTFFDGKYSNFRRYRQIIKVLLHYGFDEMVAYMEESKRFKLVRKFISSRKKHHAIQLSKWERIRMVCEELGPTFIKFGQLLSNRPDILPAELVVELEKLQDGVPPVSGDIAQSVVEKSFGKSIEKIFSSFEKNALASASMAQVHKARLLDGKEVVIKIQRPDIRRVIESDIRVMKYIANELVRRVPSLRGLDPVGLVRNFEESILHELDFVHESVNIQRFRSNIHKSEKRNGYIYSPRVYSELTTSKVLTMELVKGIKITDFQRIDAAGLNRKIIARRLAHSYLRQIFEFGFFHADPHPGNLFVLPGNLICYLDYGMMGNIMQKDLELLGSLFLAVRSKDVRKIIYSLQQLSDQPVVRKKRQLEADLNEFVQNHAFRVVHENEMSSVLNELKNIIVRYGLRAPSHFFLLGRSMLTIEGVIRNLDPSLRLDQLSRPYIVTVVANHYNPAQFTKRVLNSVYEMGMYMEEFPRDLKTAIRKINSGEVKVELTHKGVDLLSGTIRRTSRHLVNAMILSALILASTFMFIFRITPLWGEKSLWGLLGFFISFLMAWRMISAFRREQEQVGEEED
jgi:ubiquinone biosynthesis protein